MFSPVTRIQTVKIVGIDQYDAAAVEEAVFSYDTQILPLHISGLNFFIFPLQDLQTTLVTELPQYRNIQVQKQFPQTIQVRAQKRVPALVRCPLVGTSCFILDTQGVQFSTQSHTAVSSESLVVVEDHRNDEHGLFETGMDPKNIEFITTFVQELRMRTDEDIVDALIIPHEAPRELTLRSREGWAAFVAFDTDPVHAAEFIRIALDESMKEDPERELEYIDARYTDKVYYKFIEQNDDEDDVEEDGDSESETVEEETDADDV
jgi:cell division septal protein FtsQ